MLQPPPKQRTIARPVELCGRGLFSGQMVRVTFRPAPDNHGVVFVRQDLGGADVPAHIRYVSRRPRRTALRKGQAVVETTEHCLSAVAGLGIDNLIIELTGQELPDLDGSSLPYVQVLQEAGLVEGQAPRRQLVLDEPVHVEYEQASLAALPSSQPYTQLLYELEYPRHPVIGRQVYTFCLGRDDYVSQIAPARTFALEEEARILQAAGVGRHLTAKDVLVFGPTGPLEGNALRFADEPVRHKISDLIGDLFLLGAQLQARVIASRSGHALNHVLVRRLANRLAQQERQVLAVNRPVLDVRKLSRILPHRYPMLLVDRILEIDGQRRVLGVKNVTINEPFFQGHFPGTPIMPGVLVVEAMAQLSGVLLGQGEENRGRLAVLLSLDRVKLRRPVVPGDQLILEAETVRIRTNVAHMRCRAYVGQEIAAEAEIKFMLVDSEQL